ncbi:ABC transporter substrate-binding protein [Methylocapsa sp. S129]|uniref:ABC transporter substrate-binding protein n=1 Tax=Methylocapsa sp. S129 TaxID=1641869 RepID=UPI00131C045D|nr:ABC transporter substrate-binding protein [Methylocapsa sp. S129]
MNRTRLAALSLAALSCIGGAASAELPQAIQQAGALQASVNAIYPPMEYKDPASGQLTGLDVDLGEALAKRLGVKIVWSESAFEQLMPSLQTGRADLIISGLTDRVSRHEAADFVDYLKTGAQFYVLAGSPAKAESDLCGKRAGTSRSTSFPAEIAAWSKTHCESAGKPAIEVVNAESTVDARSQLRQGRIDAAVQGSETIPYAFANEPNTYRVLGAPFTTGYQGIAVKKGETALRDALADALGGLIADGSYRATLTKYNLQDNAMAEPIINGAMP